MYARRFRLDGEGNLHADGLFCRLLATDPAIQAEARTWLDRKNLDGRAAKARAKLDFETAWTQRDYERALDIARKVHVLMMAQRLRNPRHRVSVGETEVCDTRPRSQSH
jgi:hypothetical protein